MELSTVYLFLFFLGLFFALVSLVMNILGGDFGHGHVDVSHAGGDLLGHGDITTGHQTGGSELHFSPFSPQVISTFAAAFGGAGYLCLNFFDTSKPISLAVAAAAGILLGFSVFYMITKFFIQTQASSEPRTNELIGTSAEVTVGIPKGGTGEVGYTTMGSRYTAPAVSVSGEEIPGRTIVLIQRISAGLFHVEPLRNTGRK